MRHKLIERRKAKGFTQEQMAAKLNIRRNTYTQYETGVSNPSLERAQAIKEILKYYKDDIFLNSEVKLNGVCKGA